MKKVLLLILLIGGISYLAINILLSSPKPAEKAPEKAKITQMSKFPLNTYKDFQIGVFASDLNGVRDLEFSDGETLIGSVTSAGKVVALPDKNNDGKTDMVQVVLQGLNKPHGLAFYQNKLYVTEETQVARYSWDEGMLIAKLDKVLFSLPKGERHFTRSLAFDRDGRLFVSIGSTCDVCFEDHSWLGSVIVTNPDGDNPKVFTKGLRNAVFLTLNNSTNEVWATEMGRDFLGDEKPPDEINILKIGKDYGWPLCFGNKVYDDNFGGQAQKDDPCEATEAPVYEIAAHSAPLGLVFIDSVQFPTSWQGDLLVSYHGSWNRSIPIGYKVVRMDVEGNKIVKEEDFLTSPDQALGRPVDLVFDKAGSLFISDDKAGIIYKVVRK